MKINDFKLEVYFGKYEFSAPYLLTQSDCASMTIEEILNMEEGAKDSFMKMALGYTEVPGNPELREVISSLYDTMVPDNIGVHAGAQEPIFNIMNVLLEEGDHIITQFPIYQSLFEVANSIGCDVSRWNLIDQGDRWNLNIDELETMIRPETKLIVVNSPNNPTGHTLKRDEMERIAEIARKHDIYVFFDEVYKGIELDQVKRPWFADIYEKGISLGVMSKSYGLAGLRIGWIASKDTELLEKAMKMKHYTSICSSGPSEYISTIALRNSDKILNKNLQIIKDNLESAREFFNEYKSLFNFIEPMAGPVAYVKMNIDKPIEEFCNELVEKHGILLLPAEIYSHEGQYFRIGLGRKDFKENLNRFRKVIESMT